MSVAFLQAALADGFPEEFGKVVHDDGWESDGKYQTNCTVIQMTEEDVKEFPEAKEGYYMCIGYRSGSYFSDYEYGDWSVNEVEPYEEVVTLTKWRNKS